MSRNIIRHGGREPSDRDLLLFLALCLSFDRSPSGIARLRRRLGSRRSTWPALIEFANRELLAPTVWVALRDKELTDELPAACADYLRRAHAVNRVRNDRIRGELEAAIAALNRAGIRPVLLKGAVELFVGRYPEPGARILRDLDLLVLREDHDRAVQALVSLDYEVEPREVEWVTYWTGLARAGAIAPIDLHWYVSAQRGLLSPEEAWRDSVLHRVGDLEFRLLSTEHQIVHNLLHSELQDHGSHLAFVWLRQLVDFGALCRLHEGSMDWAAVRSRFDEHGLARVPVTRLYMAQRLLGLPMPAEIRPTLAARLHYRRCLAQLRWRWPMALARLWATLASPLDSHLLDTVYGLEGGRLELARVRIRHAFRLLHSYHGRLTEIVRHKRAKFE